MILLGLRYTPRSFSTRLWRIFAAVLLLALLLANSRPGAAQTSAPATAHNDVVIKNAVVMTVTHGNVQNGSVYIKDGKIAAVGVDVKAPASAVVIDAGGQVCDAGDHRLAFPHCAGR